MTWAGALPLTPGSLPLQGLAFLIFVFRTASGALGCEGEARGRGATSRRAS